MYSAIKSEYTEALYIIMTLTSSPAVAVVDIGYNNADNTKPFISYQQWLGCQIRVQKSVHSSLGPLSMVV